MKMNKFWLGILSCGACLATQANERFFTYSYEPETMPQGAWEFEQWVTLRTQRTKNVGQQNYDRWEIRESIEYGFTDNYTAELYLNLQNESFRDPATAIDSSDFKFTGISFENRYMVLNPAEHAVGMTLYVEPRYSGTEAELEEKIIIGQRHGAWKWAVNLTHATEWEDHFQSTEGEVEVSAGLTYALNKHWNVGLEIRDHNEIPDYNQWENTALYLGPVVSYHQERWWAALTIMPQIYGANYKSPEPDGISGLELEGHERVNIRLLFGISF
jgi:hypothetical protein